MADLKEFKCPNCGGAITFSPGAQNLVCPYCNTEFEIASLEAYNAQLEDEIEEDLTWDKDAGSSWRPGETEGMRVYSCQSCGGEIVGDANTAATSCPFCGNPVVMTGQFQGDLRPDYVIPFKLDKEQAKQKYREHLTGKKLLPRVFKDENHIDEIKGIYVPYWLFDAQVNAYMRYKGTRTRMWSDGNYNYTETSYYGIQRSGNIAFSKVPADGSLRMDDVLMESIEPFDFSEAVDFKTAYLAGFFADKYDVSAEENKQRIDARVRVSAEQAFASTVQGYATVTPEVQNIRYMASAAHYALYPVWLLNTTWQGERYTFAMNGQTGRFVGDLPVDKSAQTRYFLLIMIIVAIVIYAALWLMKLM